jgi:hypothetical protein
VTLSIGGCTLLPALPSDSRCVVSCLRVPAGLRVSVLELLLSPVPPVPLSSPPRLPDKQVSQREVKKLFAKLGAALQRLQGDAGGDLQLRFSIAVNSRPSQHRQPQIRCARDESSRRSLLCLCASTAHPLSLACCLSLSASGCFRARCRPAVCLCD